MPHTFVSTSKVIKVWRTRCINNSKVRQQRSLWIWKAACTWTPPWSDTKSERHLKEFFDLRCHSSTCVKEETLKEVVRVINSFGVKINKESWGFVKEHDATAWIIVFSLINIIVRYVNVLLIILFFFAIDLAGLYINRVELLEIFLCVNRNFD